MNDASLPPGAASFPNTRYHEQWRLVTWRPLGTLDDDLLDRIVQFMESEERSIAGPFDRFADLSALDNIRLKIGHLFELTAHRREMRAGHEPVKSAIYANTVVGFGMARMYEHLLDGSAIHVRPFRELPSAADWLRVPLEILQPEALPPSALTHPIQP
jgi:hypothetical protein